jgi:uncharacterized membrane protein YeiH
MAGGALSVVLGIAARKRRFDPLSLPGFAVLGALGGGLLAGAALMLGVGNLAVPDLLTCAAIISVVTIPVSALAAAGTLALARMAEDDDPREKAGRFTDEGSRSTADGRLPGSG